MAISSWKRILRLVKLKLYFKFNFYRVHWLYILTVDLIGASALVALEDHLSFIDAFFLASSAVTCTGLSSVNFALLRPSSQVVIAILIILGSTILLSLIPVIIRRYYFRQRATKFMRAHLKEYTALKILFRVIITYYLLMHLGSFLLMGIYLQHSPSAQEILARNNETAFGWAAFHAISGFNNAGFSTFADNLIPMNNYPLILLVICFLTLAGNTGFPLILRLLLYCLRKLFPKRYEGPFKYLLEHPRRCFTLLFLPKQTWWLFLVLLTFNLIELIGFLALDWSSPALDGFSIGRRVVNGIFSSFVTRTSGFNSVDISLLTSAMHVLYLGMMYISSTPVVVAVRASEASSESSLEPPSEAPSLAPSRRHLFPGSSSSPREGLPKISEEQDPPEVQAPPAGDQQEQGGSIANIPPPSSAPSPPALLNPQEGTRPSSPSSLQPDHLPLHETKFKSKGHHDDEERGLEMEERRRSTGEESRHGQQDPDQHLLQQETIYDNTDVGGWNPFRQTAVVSDALTSQARNLLVQDSFILFIILFVICILEDQNLKTNPDFSIFKILFEMASSYGTVGLSLGYQGMPFSFAGAWSTGSKFLLSVVMLMGRHRGLPTSIDTAVQISFNQSLIGDLQAKERAYNARLQADNHHHHSFHFSAVSRLFHSFDGVIPHQGEESQHDSLPSPKNSSHPDPSQQQIQPPSQPPQSQQPFKPPSQGLEPPPQPQSSISPIEPLQL